MRTNRSIRSSSVPTIANSRGNSACPMVRSARPPGSLATNTNRLWPSISSRSSRTERIIMSALLALSRSWYGAGLPCPIRHTAFDLFTSTATSA